MKTTFLRGELEETIYIDRSLGIVALGQESKVCLLKKHIYVLKQSSRQWYKRFDSYIYYLLRFLEISMIVVSILRK